MSKKAPKRTQGSNKRNRMRKADLLQLIMELFNQNQTQQMNYRQVSAALGVTAESQRALVSAYLQELCDRDFLQEVSRGRYRLNMRGAYLEGVVERQGGKHYLVPADGGDAVFIPDSRLKHALVGDTVRICLYARRRGRQPEGGVVEILKRSADTFVGVLDVAEHAAYLITDDRNLPTDIFIPKSKLNGGQNAQKAVARITDWPEHAKHPVGEVVDVLGDQGKNDTEMHAILAEFGLPYRYPKDIEEVAAKIDDGITADEVARRRDMRGVCTFTIDPRDAKDFDDALSVRQAGEGLWEVGVHIADVTHYVRPGSVIDDEARRRATSVYLVDRTVPMLPEHLSNGICSLRPDEDKLCFSVLFLMNDKAEVQRYEIQKTVIRSCRRFTYEEAQAVIQSGQGDCRDELLTLDRLAKIMRQERFDHGAVNFEREEVKFVLDESGRPVGISAEHADDSHHLIEEFMLLANRTVATHIGHPGRGRAVKTFVYRIHDVPFPDRMENFARFIKRFGYSLKTTGRHQAVSASLNQLIAQVQGRPEQNLVETLAIRSMARAVYSTVNIGHYGLAFDYYTHFTSPIRRYPDMMVHRLLTRYLLDRKGSVDAETTEDLCQHCSDREQLAASAERASIKYKQVEYMKARMGREFDGIISGVTEWGIYVELTDNKCEGLVSIRDLADNDYFYYDEQNYCLEGRRTHRRYQLGDPIRIRVARADLYRRQLDFVPVGL